jgi:hypothetical protein
MDAGRAAADFVWRGVRVILSSLTSTRMGRSSWCFSRLIGFSAIYLGLQGLAQPWSNQVAKA